MNVSVSLRAADLMPRRPRPELHGGWGPDVAQVTLGEGIDIHAYVTPAEARLISAAWSALAVRLAAADGSGWVVQEDATHEGEDATHEGGAVDGVDTAGGALQSAGSDDLNIGRSASEAPPVAWSCGKVNDRGFTCTEPSGHSGDHIALDDLDEFCDQWPVVDSDPTPAHGTERPIEVAS